VTQQTLGPHTVFFTSPPDEYASKTIGIIDLDHDHYLYASVEHDIEDTAAVDTKRILIALLDGLELLGDYASAIRQRTGRHSTVTQTTEGLIDCGTFQLPAPEGMLTSVPTPSFLVLTVQHEGCDIQIQMFITPKTPEEQQYPRFPAFLLPGNLNIINTDPGAYMLETTLDGRETGIVFSVMQNFLSFSAAIEMDENSYLSVSANGQVEDGVDADSLKLYLLKLVNSLQFEQGNSQFAFEGQHANYTYDASHWEHDQREDDDEEEDDDEVDPDWEPNDWDDEDEDSDDEDDDDGEGNNAPKPYVG